MKKVFVLTALAIGSATATMAQTTAGAIAVGATVGISATSSKTETKVGSTTTSTDGPKTTTFSFLPDVSYFLSDKLALGIAIGYRGENTSRKTNSNGTDYELKNKGGAFLVEPFAKYYISVGEKAAFLLRGGLGLQFGNNKDQRINTIQTGPGTFTTTIVEDPTKSTTISIGVRPGFIFFPADKWGVELSLGQNLLGYSHRTDKVTGTGYESKTKYNTIEFLNINTLGVGASVYYFIK